MDEKMPTYLIFFGRFLELPISINKQSMERKKKKNLSVYLPIDRSMANERLESLTYRCRPCMYVCMPLPKSSLDASLAQAWLVLLAFLVLSWGYDIIC